MKEDPNRMPSPSTHKIEDTGLALPQADRALGADALITVGATGRVWKLPFSLEKGEGRDCVRFSGPNEYDTALATCQFLRTHLPKLFDEWRDQFNAARLKDNPYQGTPFATRALREAQPISELISPLQFEGAEAPSFVPLPEIGPDHWFRRRHKTVGNFIAQSKDPEGDSQREFEQDYSCLKFYLSKYDTLARTYSGEALFEATTWAAFRDPYFSCMQLCLLDLKLPPAFMALVNHGIGAQLAVGQRFSGWFPYYLSDEDQALLDATRAIFSGLTRMFVEDFPRHHPSGPDAGPHFPI